MSAPFGNDFWTMREKHGRDRVVESPEKLWAAAKLYFKHVDDNPEMELDFRGKDATEVLLPKKQPYTMHDLCLFLGVNTEYFRQFKSSIEGRTDEKSKDFSRVIRDIEDTVYSQKFKGAASGFFNANIIARDLGLADKSEIKADVKTEQVDYSLLSDEALKEIADAERKSNQG